MSSDLTLPDSLWAATAKPAPETHSLNGQCTADVAIVGAGFTGLRAALELSSVGKSVVVLDAGDIGWGASGRNGGQVNPLGHEAPSVIAERWQRAHGADGETYAERLSAVILQSANELFDVVRKHNIDCDAEQNGWIRALHGEAARADFESQCEDWQRVGADIRMLSDEEVSNTSGTTGYLSGCLVTQGGSLQPLSYARGLAKAALTAGATIHTHSKVDSLQQSGDQWRLSTAKGEVTADQVLLCTNGYTDNLYPGLRRTVVPVISIQGATQPLTDKQIAEILPQRQTFADTRRVIFYFRKTAENRLVFGSAGMEDSPPGQSERKRIIEGLRTVYPQFPELKPEYLWGGRIAVTYDHLPHLHQPAPGLYAGLGCNGRGVAMSTVMGRLLAEFSMGKPAEELHLPVTAIKAYPFHRFRDLGIRVTVPWWQLRDQREAKQSGAGNR